MTRAGPSSRRSPAASSQAGRPFAHGFEIYLERATLSYGFANLAGEGHPIPALTVILPDGTVERPDLGSGDPIDAFMRELALAVGAVADDAPAPALEGELARQALALCLAEVQSVFAREQVTML